jgi:hypothetical protein
MIGCGQPIIETRAFTRDVERCAPFVASQEACNGRQAIIYSEDAGVIRLAQHRIAICRRLACYARAASPISSKPPISSVARTDSSSGGRLSLSEHCAVRITSQARRARTPLILSRKCLKKNLATLTCYPPSAIMLFLSRRNFRACSATTSFNSRASRHRSLTSLWSLPARCRPQGAIFRPPGTPSTKCNTGSRQCLRAGRVPRVLCSPRRPSGTMRIFSSTKYCLRVAR